MTRIKSIAAAVVVFAAPVFAQKLCPVPRERILADLVKRADDTYKKIGRPNASYGYREIFTSMLAYAEAGTNLTRVAELLILAERMQNRDPGHRAYGNFRWYARDTEVMDFNAVDFCMQHGALLWRFHRNELDPATRDRLHKLLICGLKGLLNHRPRTTYTNIALLNASDLILLGESLGDAEAVAEGEHRIDRFIKTLWEEGAHEYVSPTYYGVDVEAMMLLEALAQNEATRAVARTLAAYFWTDIALNWYAPAQRLAGAHSRTYDYVFGGGELDQILSACGWLPLAKKFVFTTFIPLYSRWQPPPELWQLSTARYPRLVEQTWGAQPFCSRTHYVCSDVTLSTAWKAYPGRMDIMLSADLPDTREERLPRLSFIPDGRKDPYGKIPVFDGKTHSKAFHLSPWWAGVQDKADVLGVALYRDSDFKDATGTLDSHLLFRKKPDSLWIDETRIEFSDTTNTAYTVPSGSAVFLRQGTAVIGIRVPWARGQDGSDSPAAIVDDRNPFGAARLTVSHTWLAPSAPAAHVSAGVAFWLRAGSGIGTDEAFAAFRKNFTAVAAVNVSSNALSIQVAGLNQPLRITAQAPFESDPITVPAPPRTILGLDGNDIGRKTLEQNPLIQTYLATREQAIPVTVSAERPTVWEAEQGRLTVPYEAATDDAAASNGAYLWEPETEGQRGGGSGQATYTLIVNTGGLFRLSARVLTPTPDDDSFFVSIRSGTGTDLFPEIAWSPGVFKTWVWSDVTVPGKRDTATFELPKGNAILTLRPREAGAKIDQFRLTPISRR